MNDLNQNTVARKTNEVREQYMAEQREYSAKAEKERKEQNDRHTKIEQQLREKLDAEKEEKNQILNEKRDLETAFLKSNQEIDNLQKRIEAMGHDMKLAEQDKAHLNARIKDLNQEKHDQENAKFTQDKEMTTKAVMLGQ